MDKPRKSIDDGRGVVHRAGHAGLSHRGRFRGDNEDRWFADDRQQLYIVSDGMGGHLAGELASRLVVEILPQRLRKTLGTTADLADPPIVDRVAAAVSELSGKLRDESRHQPGLDGMGATVVLALIRAAQALVLHLGDSRAYLLRAGRLERLTRDHSIVELLLAGGRISPQQAASHPAKGRLTRYVGMTGRALPETRLVDLHPGDRLLLCTDGLSDMLDDERLREILVREPDLQQVCRRLIDAANDAGGKDNLTALVVAA